MKLFQRFALPWALLALLPAAGFAAEAKVFLILIDGVRSQEILGPKSKEIFPTLTRMKAQGVFLPEMRIANPVGISLPGYADIFAGRRQEKIVTNEPAEADFHSHYPTIFQAARKTMGQADAVAVIASWQPLCKIAVTPDGGDTNDFFRSCGWDKARDLKPEVYEGSRTDMDNFLVALQEIPKRHPRLVFLHFGDADEEAHLQRTIAEKKKLDYGIFNYHKALKETDYYIERLQKLVNDDPFYKGSTYFIVATDHGRDDVPTKDQWADHGECLTIGDKKLCSGCRHVFGLATGPGLKPRVVKREYTHEDLAPTVARLLGVPFPSAKGAAISEIAPGKGTL